MENTRWVDPACDSAAGLPLVDSLTRLQLLVADLGNGQLDMKLKVYKGTELAFETPLLDLPTGVCTFYMDTTDPHTPAVAVASGSFVYIYKNLRPYFKFTLPNMEVSQP